MQSNAFYIDSTTVKMQSILQTVLNCQQAIQQIVWIQQS